MTRPRTRIPATLVSTALVVYLVCASGTLVGQTPAPGPAAAAQDLSQVQIKATKLSESVYMLEGQGGAIGVLAGPDGVLMVDSQFAPLTEKIVAAIRQIAPASPIRYLVNTHVHGDHTGGNENLGKIGVTILAREQLRARLANPNPQANGQPGVPAPAAALPGVTYDAPMTLRLDSEEVRLIPVPRAHTDGDTMVYFTRANVLFVGDFYRATGYPNIDRANGGTLPGMLEGLSAVVALATPTTKIVPGHGAVVDEMAVTRHREMIIGVRDTVTTLIAQNKTLEEVVAAKPTAAWDGRVTGATAMTADRFVGQLYMELRASR